MLLFGLTDYVPPEDWGPEFPIPGTVRPNVPIPTLYSADGESPVRSITTKNIVCDILKTGQRLKPKLSIIELVLYNIAAMLAGVASGYDVRLSNVSPLHPRLQPNRYNHCLFPFTYNALGDLLADRNL